VAAPRPVAGLNEHGAAVVAVLVGLVVAAVSLAAVAAQPGGVVGLTRDGVSYLGAAANLASGRGLTGAFTTGVDVFSPAEAVAFAGRVPFVQWPPLLPAVLAVAEAWSDAVPGVAGRRWAGLINALALAGVAGLTTWATIRLATHRGAAGTTPSAGAMIGGVAAGVVVAAPAEVAVAQLVVSTEPLFTLLVLLAVLAAVHRLRGASERWLVAALALAGAAALTRFVGVVVVVGLVMVLWRDAQRRASGWRRHQAPVVAALALAPVVIWWAVTTASAGGRTRSLGWHPPAADQWASVGTTVWSWVASTTGPGWQRLVLAIFGALALVGAVVGWRHAWRRDLGAPGRAWWQVVTTVVPLYLVAVVATHALVDRVVPIGGRLLSPLLPLVVPLVAAGVVWAVRALPTSRMATLPRTAVAIVAVVVAVGSVVSASTGWRELASRPAVEQTAEASSATGAWLRALGPETLVVANDPAFAWMSSPRPGVIDAPTRQWVAAGRDNDDFDTHLDQLAVLLEGDAVVVLYDLPAALSPNYVTRDELTARLGLVVVAETADGVVLARPGWSGANGGG
jgi:hypothetical protein